MNLTASNPAERGFEPRDAREQLGIDPHLLHEPA
jgi:hypothetical protein